MRWVSVGLVVTFCLCVAPLRAEEVNETWRSPFGTPTSVAVDPTDGSVWAATGASLMHVSAAGDTLLQVNGFFAPVSVAVDPRDGSAWVADSGSYSVTGGEAFGAVVEHLSRAGSVLWQGTSFSSPSAVAVNPSDGSVWVADAVGSLSHLASDGSPLWQGMNFLTPLGLSVNPADGSCWVADEGVYDLFSDLYRASVVVHVSASGDELWRSQYSDFSAATAVAVNAADGSVWVADAYAAQVKHLTVAGDVLWTGADFSWPWAVACSSDDGSVWVADGYGEVTHWSGAGLLTWRGDSGQGFLSPAALALNQEDGSCWVADTGNDELVHVTSRGAVSWRQAGLGSPVAVDENWLDGSLWVSVGADVVHLGKDGTELSHSSGFYWATSLSVSLLDGSCWVADEGCYNCGQPGAIAAQVVRLSATGDRAWQSTRYQTPFLVSASHHDGACWLLDWGAYSATDDGYPDLALVRLSPAGDELLRKTGFSDAMGIAASQADGGCWVADATGSGGVLLHYAADGSETWRSSDFAGPVAVAADAGDGSVWVGDEGMAGSALVHLSTEGVEVGRSTALSSPTVLAPNPMDGTCWVGDTWNGLVAHLGSDGGLRWTSPAYPEPFGLTVDPADGSCWVADDYHGQVARLTPAAYVTPTGFWDVPVDQWAAAQIRACAAGRIVSGYPDGSYRSADPVTRGQMAVYIARALRGGSAGVPTGPAVATFPDVPTDSWAFKYVEFAKGQGVVAGYPDGTYQPGDQVDRGQMAVYIARAMAHPVGEDGLASYTPPGSPSFPDVPVNFWAYKYVEYCKSTGTVAGYPDGYRPGDVVTRDQMAVYVSRAFALQ